MSDIAVNNTSSALSGKTLQVLESDQTVTGLHTYDRDPSAPFAVTASSAVVTNLDADKLDGQDGSYYTNASNLASGTAPTARLGSGSASSSTFLRGDSTWQALTISNSVCDGRLTLTSGTPVTTADVTGATNIYFTPYKGKYIALYDGSSSWVTIAFSETTLALGTLTNDLPYDVFGYSNSGTLTLEALAWTNKTTRATALTLQDGVLVKTGATTRRYLGTFHTTATTTTEDSAAKRLLWNYYNRARKHMRVIEATDTWTYTTATYRQANNAAANQLAFVLGYAEEAVQAEVLVTASNSGGAVTVAVAIGEDSTSTPTTGQLNHIMTAGAGGAGLNNLVTASLKRMPAVGYHFWAWLEWSTASGTTTWVGDNGATIVQSGIHGSIAC